MAVYESDPDARPDSAFATGTLAHLAEGNSGRLLDPRRTPVRIAAIEQHTGQFEVEILAFEDRGARWLVPFEDVARYQFALDSHAVDAAVLARYRETVERLDQPLRIEPDERARARTLQRIAAERAAAARWLSDRAPEGIELEPLLGAREGDHHLMALLEGYLAQHELGELEREFSEQFVSNPDSGELVKGHAIVLAELGLCAYAGKVVRTGGLFAGAHAREHRAEHLIVRLAFTAALWERVSCAGPLYRALAGDRLLERREPRSFISATFAAEVARSHFDAVAPGGSAALLRQSLPPGRLLMSFLETRALNERYREAEAVLIGAGAGAVF